MKKLRGKKYTKAKKLIKEESMPLKEAIEAVKKASYAKFGGVIELKVVVNTDPKDNEQNIRFTCTLPHAFGKKKKVLAFGNFKQGEFKTLEVIGASETSIDDILANKLTPKKDFDMVICEASFMPKLAKAARILGPKGLMPNPKTNTVGELDKILKSLDAGQVEVRVQPSNRVIHLSIGKVETQTEELVKNYKTLIDEINKKKPTKVKKTLIENIYIKATMSPSIKIKTT